MKINLLGRSLCLDSSVIDDYSILNSAPWESIGLYEGWESPEEKEDHQHLLHTCLKFKLLYFSHPYTKKMAAERGYNAYKETEEVRNHARHEGSYGRNGTHNKEKT